MKICAIIAEFNPFHIGHQKLLENAKKQTGCDHMFCFMGQNFTERGEPTLLNKQTRAQMAINGGFDAVFEIPNALTIVNAELFATFMLKAILSFPHITHLAFGSECGKIEPILELANFLNNETSTYKKLIKKYLQEGHSLGICKQKALEYVVDKKLHPFKNPKITKTLLLYPNNILAVEYAKILLKENSKIVPITFKREKISATEIRNLCEIGKVKETKQMLGECNYNVMANAQKNQSFPNKKLFDDIKLMSARLCNFDMAKVLDVGEGLDKKIQKEAQNSLNYSSFLSAVSGKRYAKNRIQRIMLSHVLEIDKSIIEKALKRKNLPFLKAICIKRKPYLLPEITKSKTRIILRKTDAEHVLSKNKLAIKLNEIDNKCEKLYSLLTNKKPNINNLFVKTEFVK